MDRLRPPAAVIFDLDGTLVDTVPTRIAAWAQAVEERGIPATAAQLGPLIGSDGRMLARRVAAEAGVDLAEDAVEELDRHHGEIFGALNTDPAPLPGVVAALAALDARGLTWAIATSSGRDQVQASVDALDLDHEPTVVDGGHVARAKPAPDLLLLAARELDVPPEACWYVGDSSWDMEAAAAAGMVPIAVMAGAAVERDVLVASGARVVLDTADELIRLLPG